MHHASNNFRNALQTAVSLAPRGTSGESTMPYYGGAYAGLSAVDGVDYHANGGLDEPFYRVGTNPNQPIGLNLDLDRGVNELQANFRLSSMGSGEWFNYTRTFPAGKYNVYGGISNGGPPGGADGEYAILQIIDSPTNPTLTNNVGLFDAPNTGAWGYNAHLVPLTDPNGKLVELSLAGPVTLRYWLPTASTKAITVAGVSTLPKTGSGDWDFMLFTPAVASGPALNWTRAGGQLRITYSGNLYSAPSVLGPWTKVTGASSPYPVPTTGPSMFFTAGP